MRPHSTTIVLLPSVSLEYYLLSSIVHLPCPCPNFAHVFLLHAIHPTTIDYRLTQVMLE